MGVKTGGRTLTGNPVYKSSPECIFFFLCGEKDTKIFNNDCVRNTLDRKEGTFCLYLAMSTRTGVSFCGALLPSVSVVQAK